MLFMTTRTPSYYSTLKMVSDAKYYIEQCWSVSKLDTTFWRMATTAVFWLGYLVVTALNLWQKFQMSWKPFCCPRATDWSLDGWINGSMIARGVRSPEARSWMLLRIHGLRGAFNDDACKSRWSWPSLYHVNRDAAKERRHRGSTGQRLRHSLQSLIIELFVFKVEWACSIDHVEPYESSIAPLKFVDIFHLLTPMKNFFESFTCSSANDEWNDVGFDSPPSWIGFFPLVQLFGLPTSFWVHLILF